MNPRFALSLGASFLGYATHAGFLCQLRDRGYAPTHVAGSSAGALAAALFAAGLDTATIMQAVTSHALRWSFVKRTFWGYHFTRSMVWCREPSCFNPRGAVDFVKSLVGDVRIQDLKTVHLTIGLSDLQSKRGLLVTEGPLAEAAVASCCVPTMMAPTLFEGQLCYDGGVSHETPVDQWFQAADVDRIVVHRILHTAGKPARSFPGNFLSLTRTAHDVICDQLLAYRQQLAELHGKQFHLVNTSHPVPSVFSRSSQMEALFALGQQQADAFIGSL
ncbi:MAG: patatin-like phospholipase family protein [Verrucomicrobiaceae bacterium]|jgi:NTE family protein